MSKIVGIILAGGTGSRLRPITYAVNKHLLPIYDRPAIAFALDVMQNCDPDIVVIICNRKDEEIFSTIHKWLGYENLDIKIVVQERPNGIAGAIFCANTLLNLESYHQIVVTLGDTLYIESLSFVQQLIKASGVGVSIAVKRHPEPWHFGVVEYTPSGVVKNISEKSTNKLSDIVCTGLYCFDTSVWGRIETLVPSSRGELEITDLLKTYIKENKLTSILVPQNTQWFDIGTHDRLLEASNARRNWLTKNMPYLKI